MSIERIFPHDAPTPRGPYSPAVRAGDFIFVSGQGPIDVTTDKLSNGDIQHETRLVLNNIKRILESCGAKMTDVVKCSVFLRDVNEFKAMNEVYKEFFGDARPARTTVGCEFVSDMRVEIDAVAYVPRVRS
jgi:2-iminobutanoate/2-iminopropanoate deaminase